MIDSNSPVIAVAVTLAIGMLVVSLVLALWRVMRGPSLPDRVIALDLVGAIVMGLIATYCVMTGKEVFLNANFVIALIVFLGTVAFARYLERSGSQ